MKKRNPIALALCTKIFKQKRIPAKKGRGSYKRRDKYCQRRFSFVQQNNTFQRINYAESI